MEHGRRVRKIANSDYSFAVSLCPYVCLSVRMEQLGFQWTDIHAT